MKNINSLLDSGKLYLSQDSLLDLYEYKDSAPAQIQQPGESHQLQYAEWGPLEASSLRPNIAVGVCWEYILNLHIRM